MPTAAASKKTDAPAVPRCGTVALTEMAGVSTWDEPEDELGGGELAVACPDAPEAFGGAAGGFPIVIVCVAFQPDGHSATGQFTHERLSASGFSATLALIVCVPSAVPL